MLTYVYMCRVKLPSTVGVKKSSVSVPFRSVLLVINGQKKWRAVLPVPFCPFCLLVLAPAHAQMILRIDVYACEAVNTRPSLASSLARPELNGRNGTERLKNGENGTERTIKLWSY